MRRPLFVFRNGAPISAVSRDDTEEFTRPVWMTTLLQNGNGLACPFLSRETAKLPDKSVSGTLGELMIFLPCMQKYKRNGLDWHS